MSMSYRTHHIRRVLALSLLAVLILTGGFIEPTAGPKEGKPNILFILVDDLGWTDIGAFGSTFYETPTIDALTSKGVKFTNAYAACPVCSPTRASIMTGKYPARMHTTDWFGAPQPETVSKHWTRDKPLLPAPYEENIPLSEVTLAETLKSNGYSTFFAGKWHLGEPTEFWPEKQGFDVNKGGYTAGSPKGKGYFSPYDNPRLADGPPGENLTDRLASETISFINNHKSGPRSASPFLAYLSFYSVHTPLQAPQDLVDKYTAKKQRLGLEDKWGQEGDQKKVRLNQCLPVYGAMVESMDKAVGKVLTALLEMAGLPLLPSQHQDGMSIAPVLRGKTITRGPIYWHYPHYGNQGGSPGSAVRDSNWKLTERFEDGRGLCWGFRV